MADRTPDGPRPLSWRVSPVQTTALLLLVCACAALDIYGHPSSPVRTVALLVGLGAFAVAIVTMRMFLQIDEDGVGVRYIGAPVWLPWSEIDRIEIVSGVRGSDTIRFSRADGTSVDAPPSLLQPSRPTSKPTARHLLKDVLSQIELQRRTYQ